MCDCGIYNNTFKPYANHTVTVYHPKALIDLIKTQFIPNKSKYIGLIDRKKTGKKIVELYADLCPSTKILFLSSDSKDSVYYDPNTWSTFDIVLYTETITVGVDFNYDHFDFFIGVYSQPMSPDLFLQSLFRSRKFYQCNHYIFTKVKKKSKFVYNCYSTKKLFGIPDYETDIPEFIKLYEMSVKQYSSNINNYYEYIE